MTRIRVRDTGLNLGDLDPGPHNAITDVKGVGVGHYTLIEGESIRTGVTAITPHQGNIFEDRVTAAVDIINGYGKSVGLPQILFEGKIETPIMLTETLNTYLVADALIDYTSERLGVRVKSLNSVVGETNGGYLTDNFLRVIGKDQVFKAIDESRSSSGTQKVGEGNVGGGTPMTGYSFKGGIGTSSRLIGEAVVGVLVQLNCGVKEDLIISGVPVGKEIVMPEPDNSPGNSIMMIVATNVALESRQLWKIAKRTVHGLARTGAYSGNGSGDFSISFTTGTLEVEDFKLSYDELGDLEGDRFLNPLYKATVEATEESILNALFMAETMSGVEGNTRFELPIDETMRVLERYNRI